MSSIKNVLKTTPPDKVNYPATNQAHFCWQKYNEFVFCMKKNEGDEGTCKKSKQLAMSVCPEEWMSNWNDQREAGTFLGIQEKELEAHRAH